MPSTNVAPPPLPPGRLARYGAYQLRDYLVDRGLSLLVLAALLFIPAIATMRAASPGAAPEDAERHLALVRGMLDATVSNLAFLGALFGINGMVSDDRAKSYFRLLFAKPVSAPRYYAQAFVVSLVGVLIALAVLLGALRLFVAPYFPPGAFAYYAIIYVAVGGIGFLASVLGRLDWLAMAAVWTTATVLRSLDWGALSALKTPLTALLPPTHLSGPVGQQLLAGAAPPPLDVLWLAGYGALAFALGLYLLRRRALGGS
ncbi:MAG TPA: hypothetical protein VKA84_15090 [Gemmatimonadaceae bacterium]|nr:hypothetical protein [Gemmatimonadaceae bacterium]